MLDLSLLRIIKYREYFNKVYRYIPQSAIDKRTKAVTLDIKRYFDDNPEEDQLDFPAFRSLFFTKYHKGMKDEDIAYYNKLLDRMEDDVVESLRKNIINNLLELEYATAVANIVEEYQQGGDIEIVPTIDNLTTIIKDSIERTATFEYADFDDNTVGTEQADSGLEWHIPVMNNFYRNIQPADQYIVAARPGKGKTTFLTHLNAHVAPQLADNKVIVWFNNESRRQRIMARQIQSSLNVHNSILTKWQKEGSLRGKYTEVMGAHDKVRVYDIHGKNNSYLEDILENIGKDNIGMIIIDMLDNVKFPTRKDLREDQRLEQMYQWSRELGVKYNCAVFPTSQVSNEGSGLQFPEEHMLKDSKTGKQGATDGIIMIGYSTDPLLENKRFISMPKSKSKREGQSDMREEVLFDADKGRYI